MPTLTPPRAVSGYSTDAYAWGATFADSLETVADLTWPQSVTTYARMRHDPQLTAVLNAYTLPIRSAPWAVDPAGCRDEVVQLIADDLGLPVLGADPTPGSARRRGVRWAEHVRVALLHLTFGHMPFAQRYDILDGKARLAELAERMPSTIADINLDPAGRLESIVQSGQDRKIPASQLVWYVHNREGAAWQGQSMLRAAYGAWLLKHEVWRVHATSIRRFGMGVPSVEAPPGGSPAQIAEAQQLASSMRVGEQSGAGLPAGFKVALTGLTGSVPDALAFVRYLDSQMAQMALASVLNLDASPNGSRAMGETFVDLLQTGVNAIAENMADTATGLSVQMTDYNWGEAEPAPRIVCGDVADAPHVTAESIAALVKAGALVPDSDLEGWVREHWAMPAKGGTPTPVPGTTPPPAQPPVAPVPGGMGKSPSGDPGGAPIKVAAAGFGLRRLPTAVEAAAGTDFAAVQQDWQTALDSLLAEWATVSDDQRTELDAQVRSAVAGGDMQALSRLGVTTTAAAALLAEHMDSAAGDAVQRMRGEAQAQGVDVPAEAVSVDEQSLTERAGAVAAMAAGGLAASAGRKALQLWTPGASADEVASGVRDHLTSLTGAALSDALGGALSAAENEGRVAVMKAAPLAAYFASEIRDQHACQPCLGVDGTRYDTLDDAQFAYAGHGFRDCLGGPRCRGMLLAVWDTASLAA